MAITAPSPAWRDADARFALALVVFGWLPALWLLAVVVENARLLRCIRVDDESALGIPIVLMLTLMPAILWLGVAHQALAGPRARAATEALLVGSMALFPSTLGGAFGWWLVARGLIDDPASPGTLVRHPLAVTLAGLAVLAVAATRLALRGTRPTP